MVILRFQVHSDRIEKFQLEMAISASLAEPVSDWLHSIGENSLPFFLALHAELACLQRTNAELEARVGEAL